jgi:hypothetical protein
LYTGTAGSPTPVPVYNSNVVGASLSSAPVPTTLVDPALPGLTSVSLARAAAHSWAWAAPSATTLTASVSGATSTVSAAASYGGLDGADPAALTRDSASTPHVGVAVSAVADAYGTDASRTGFWRVASTALTLYSTAFAPTTAASLTQALPSSGTATLAATLHFDSLSGAPAVAPHVLAVAGATTSVCGVPTWGGGSALSSMLQLSNFANAFVASTIASASLSWGGSTLASATFGCGATLYADSGSPFAPTAAPDPIGGANRRLYPSLTVPAGNTTVFTGGGVPLTLGASLWALTGAAASTTTQVLSTSAVPYLDLPSLAAMSSATRVTSGSTQYPATAGTDYGAAFDETQSLATSYTAEVQLAAGLFQTPPAGAGGYQNYGSYAGLAGPDYSGIASTGTRYATFAFPVASVGAGNNPYNYATLTLPGCTASMSNVTFALAGMGVLLRIVGSGSGQTTAWMDGNTANNNQNIGSLGGSGTAPIFTNGAALVLNTAGTGASAPTPTSRPLILPAGTGAQACTIYVRLAFDMSVATQLGAPTLTLST